MFRGGRNCIIRMFAVSMGAGILIAAIFPNGIADVSGCHAADRQRLRLLETVERRALMNIVVWKAPRRCAGHAEKAVPNSGITKRAVHKVQ